MKKPLFYAALALSAGILLEYYSKLPWQTNALLFLICFLAAAIFCRFPGARLVFVLLSLIFLGSSRMAFSYHLSPDDISLAAASGTRPVSLQGIVISDVDTRHTFYGTDWVTLDVSSRRILSSGRSARVCGTVRMHLKNQDPPPAYGDEISVSGTLQGLRDRSNPGCFNYRAYLERIGIRAFFYGQERSCQILSRHHGLAWQAAAIKIKKFLSQTLTDHFHARDAAFLKALFLGERSTMDDDFKDLFIKTGTLHILSVSGFNIGFLALTLFFLLKPFPVPQNMKFVIVLVGLWLYCFLIGWQSPVVRASVMATLFIAAKLLGRKNSALNALGLAALLILAVRPGDFFDIGFELSFLAVFGIVAIVPIFYKVPQRLPHETWTRTEKTRIYFSELFWVSFVCLAATLPLTIQNFYIVTPVSLLANLIVVPLSFLIFFAGSVFFLTAGWLPEIFSWVPWIIERLMQVFVGSLFAIENIPGGSFICGKLHPALAVLLTAGLGFVFYDKRIREPGRRALILILFVFNILSVQGLLAQFGRSFRMTALDVGQGDAIYFEFPHGGNLLIDAGRRSAGRSAVIPFLKSKGISTIEAVVITHPQEDHAGGFLSVFDEFKIKNVIDSGRPYRTKLAQQLKEKIEKEHCFYWPVERGMEIKGFKGIHALVLNPGHGRPGTNINNDSVVLKISYQNTHFLLTADVEGPAMGDMMESGLPLRSTVLKVPHHGAKMDERGRAFIKEAAPPISLISVGERNSYGHPNPRTLKALEEIPGNRILRTDREGAIVLLSDGISVKRERIS